MDKNDKFIKNLCKRIMRGKFAWEKYQGYGAYYYGKLCVTQRVVCSYGECGYSVNFPEDSLPVIQYDYELKDLVVDDMDYKEWLDRAEHYDEYNDEWFADDKTELDFEDWLKQVKGVSWAA